jgi:hypothetical protein
MGRDLKEAISAVKKEEYQRALGRASDSTDLRVIELQVRTDVKLSMYHRSQLLGTVEAALYASMQAQPDHTRLLAKAKQAHFPWRLFP